MVIGVLGPIMVNSLIFEGKDSMLCGTAKYIKDIQKIKNSRISFLLQVLAELFVKKKVDSVRCSYLSMVSVRT